MAVIRKKRIIRRTVWRRTRKKAPARKPVITNAARSYLNSRESGISLNQLNEGNHYTAFTNNSDKGQRRT